VSDTVAVEAVAHSRKRLRRIPEEERRIVEATFVPGASIARVAREHGVNANQVFQWRYEYRRGNQGVRQQGQSRLVPVTVTAEPGSVMGPEVAPVRVGSGSIHIELPGRASISVEAGVDPELVRTVFGEPIALFVPRARVDFLKRRLAEIANGQRPTFVPKITALEEVQPWLYSSYSRNGEDSTQATSEDVAETSV
jgi:transposase